MVAAAACASMLFVNSLSLGAAFLALKEKLSPGQGQDCCCCCLCLPWMHIEMCMYLSAGGPGIKQCRNFPILPSSGEANQCADYTSSSEYLHVRGTGDWNDMSSSVKLILVWDSLHHRLFQPQMNVSCNIWQLQLAIDTPGRGRVVPWVLLFPWFGGALRMYLHCTTDPYGWHPV